MTDKAAALFYNKRILITGGSEGFGFALAKQIAQHPCVLILVARNQDKLKQAKQALSTMPADVHTYSFDLYSDNDIDSCVEKVFALHNGIDILINNAGKSIRREVIDTTINDIERVYQLNFWAPVKLVKAFLPSMVEQGYGCIINSLSISAFLPVARFSAYAASKSALYMFSENLYVEQRANNIHVHNLFLPFMQTKMIDVKTVGSGFLDKFNLIYSTDDLALRSLKGIARKRRNIRYGYGALGLFKTFFERIYHYFLFQLFAAYETRSLKKHNDSWLARVLRKLSNNTPPF